MPHCPICFPALDPALRAERLAPPARPVRAVLDTDTFNEVDDQFAIIHALLSPERIKLEAIHAAPFRNERSTGPADGMEKSFDEINRLLALLPGGARPQVCRGARQFLPDERTPVESEAVDHLIRLAWADPAPLYVPAIAALTNVASALLCEPRLVERIVVVWLGGHAPYWPHTREFNLQQDPAATRIVFASGVPLVWVPCQGVASHLITSVPELDAHLRGRGAIADFLFERVRDYGPNDPGWSKVIWDIATTAWLVSPAWLPSTVQPVPSLRDDLTWTTPSPEAHRIRIVTEVQRDAVFADFFCKIARLRAT